MTTQRRKKRGSYITGKKGKNRVRLFSHPCGKLLLEFREGQQRRYVTLNHQDWDRAEAQADEVAAKLRQHETPKGGDLTLKALFDKYEGDTSRPAKGASKQQHDRRARKLFEECWGASAKVNDLDRRDWDRFIQQRRSGALRLPGDSRRAKGVRDRVIEYDLRFLLTVCNWALAVRERGKPLMERNPFKGFKVPKEENPSRPIVSAAELEALERAAIEEGPQVSLFLLLVKETGRRCTSVARLKWSDVDLAAGKLRWRAEHDKKRRESVVALSESAQAALKRAEQQRRASGRIGDGWVFPSPSDAQVPIRRDLLRDWWEKLEKRSGIKDIRGRGWHSLRRRFATVLQQKRVPLADIMELGGWKDPNTLHKCYSVPDEASQREALKQLSAAG